MEEEEEEETEEKSRKAESARVGASKRLVGLRCVLFPRPSAAPSVFVPSRSAGAGVRAGSHRK